MRHTLEAHMRERPSHGLSQRPLKVSDSLSLACPRNAKSRERERERERPGSESSNILKGSDCVESSPYFKKRIVCPVPAVKRELRGQGLSSRKHAHRHVRMHALKLARARRTQAHFQARH